MTDVSSWSPTDSSNNSSPPAGAPEGMNPSGVNDTMRAMMGGQRRSWERTNATVLTTGAAGTYAYTPANASFPTAYVNGEIFTFRAHQDSAGNDVINVNALGAKNLYVFVNSGIIQIQAHQIKSGAIVQAMYDSTLNGAVGGFQVLGAVPRSLSPGDNTGSWTAGSVAFAAGSNSLTQDNANFFYDSTLHLLGVGKIPTAGHVLDMRGLTTAGDNGVKLQAFQASYQVLNNAATTNYYFGVDDADASKLKIGGGSGPNQGVQPAITVSGGGVPLVGINNTAPGFKLDVTGDINTSTTYKIGGTQIAASSLSNGVTGSGAVMLAASPTTTGTMTAAAITASSTVSTSGTMAATQYNIGASVFAIASGVNYLSLNDKAGNGTLFFGNASDATNYYRQTVHQFQNIGGGTSFAAISSGGFNLQSGTYQISGTQITTGALSDYSTGTWTPTDASGAGLSLTVDSANYVKVGKLVIVSAFITYPATGSGLNAQIGGLPFASKNTVHGIGGGMINLYSSTFSTFVSFAITPNSTTISVFQGNAPPIASTINSGLSSAQFGFTFSYIAA